MLVWYVEDDDQTGEYWASTMRDEGFQVKWFESVLHATMGTGNPDAILFDVGSIGLQRDVPDYMRAFRHLRDTFPNTPIFLCSGLPSLPAMLIEELGEEDHLVYVTDLVDIVFNIKKVLNEACS